MIAPFIRPLAAHARILVELEGRPLKNYAVMLQVRVEGSWQTILLFDNAHGEHDMHRYTGTEKQAAEWFADGPVRTVIPQAIRYAISNWERIEREWRD